MFNFLRSGPQGAKMTATDAVAQSASITLLDVREASELAASGRAKGALHIPLALVPIKADPNAPDCALPQGRPVAVYCASGMRSGSAVNVLKKLGYDAHNIGSIRDWVAAGGAVTR
jgi:rhodanese-related sulfurtransferase